MATTFLWLVHDHPASEYETRHRAAACQYRMSQETFVACTADERIVDNTFDLAEAIRVALQWLC